MALESLSNPLERIAACDGRGSFLGNFRSNEITNDLAYDAARQYFRGDQALSAVDGALYTFTGGVVAAPVPPAGLNAIPVSTLGGPDPYDDPLWLRNAPFAWYYSLAPTITDGAVAVPPAPNTWKVAGGVQTALLGDTDWLCVVQGTATLANPPAVVGDVSRITITSDGAAPASVSATILPALDAAGVNNWSASVVLTLPADATQVSVSGAYAGAFVPITNCKVNLVRLF